MDEKEKILMKHYKKIIEEQKFDEYDILGFLILIRRHLNSELHSNILEFAHLVAHRKRNKGKVMGCISVAINNNYETEEDGKTIVGYHGMLYENWVNEWKNLGENIGIIFNDNIIDDITMCIFSLAQFVEYIDEKNNQGRLELFIGNDGKISLVTTEGKADSVYINYAMFGKYQLHRDIVAGHIVNPVEALRDVNGVLRLQDADGVII